MHKRFGSDPAIARDNLARLAMIRDRILSLAAINEGETVVDIGTGDGLLGFAALDHVGEEGTVVFSDISQDALDFCEGFLSEGLGNGNARFLCTSAEDLSAIPSGSVDVVVGRAVLLYIAHKEQCFREYFRILRPGGRLAICEPINRFAAEMTASKKIFFGFDFTPLGSLGDRILSQFHFPPDYTNDPMLNFDERDMLGMIRSAGFREITMQYEASMRDNLKWPSWQAFLKSAPNPTVPSLAEVAAGFTPEEAQQFEAYFRPLVEHGTAVQSYAEVYFRAEKR
ncbi:MAG: class I SAM-dependent methyltransferase [Bacteroidota bacterium]|nr:class I SAM-dependent methyltransferase [Bacteroidota bacterium]MDP4236702.1 class I SAM-dependent methyltransferase [Bacteroidota bacterium]